MNGVEGRGLLPPAMQQKVEGLADAIIEVARQSPSLTALPYEGTVSLSLFLALSLPTLCLPSLPYSPSFVL